MIKIIEHKSPSYGPRTYHNAHSAQLTIALAVDFSTAGERLTKKAAVSSKFGQDAYFPVSLTPELNEHWIHSARDLYRACNRIERLSGGQRVTTLNVAGNGIYTLSANGMSQEWVNQMTYNIIAQVHQHLPFERIVSGGQTGIDIAGGIAGDLLGLPVEMTYPKNLKWRFENGQDVNTTEAEILNYLDQLKSKVITL